MAFVGMFRPAEVDLRLSERARASLFRGLAILLGAGLAPGPALDLVAGLAGSPAEARAAAALRRKVRNGASLAEAMAAFPSLRGRAVDMVRAGEACGAVAVAASRVAAVSERAVELKRGLTAAMLVPLLLLAGSVTAAAALVTVRVDLDVGKAGIAELWWLPPLGGLAVVGVLAQRAGDPRFRLALDRMLLGVPLLGRLAVEREVARLLSGLALLLKAGVALPASLAFLRRRTGNAAFAAALAGGLAPLLRQEWFPPAAARLLRDGEAAGRLAEAASLAVRTLRRYPLFHDS